MSSDRDRDLSGMKDERHKTHSFGLAQKAPTARPEPLRAQEFSRPARGAVKRAPLPLTENRRARVAALKRDMGIEEMSAAEFEQCLPQGFSFVRRLRVLSIRIRILVF